MVYDRGLAQRVREILEEQPGFAEKKMFGGICFLFYGNMACGVLKDELIVRVGPDGYDEALAQPFARQFDLTGRAMTGWVMVAEEGLDSERNLEGWVSKGLAFSLSLPRK